MKTESSNYLPTLDGWRAVAILLVMVCHGTDAIFAPNGLYPNELFYGLTRHGAVGVDIFFGISGYLICTRLLQEEQYHGRINLAKFYIRRTFRILPPYLAYLIVLGFLSVIGWVVVSRWEWLSCLLFLRNYLAPASLGGWYTGHFWSLAIEEHFYLLFPGVLMLCGSRRARWLILGIALAIAFWRFVEFRQQYLSRLLPDINFITRTDIRLDGLLWGCCLALMLEVPAWRENLTRKLFAGLWFLLVGAFVLCLWWQPPLVMLWQAALIPLILLGTVVRPDSSVSRLLELRQVRWVGRISYSLYLWQQLFLVSSAEQRPLPFGVLQSVPLNFLTVFACAALSYYVIERPMIKLGHQLSSRPKVEGQDTPLISSGQDNFVEILP